MKKRLKAIVLILCIGMISNLAACSSNSSTAPSKFTFNTTDGSFTFGTVKNADTYMVGLSKILNDTTGKALVSINGATKSTKADGSSAYIWSEQTGSCSGLADTNNDGKVTGKVVVREYSSSATKVGDVITMDKVPLGHYIAQAMAVANDKLTNPVPAKIDFVIGGTLATPSGFTAQINTDGFMEVTAPSSYYLNCLTKTGMPEKMKFEIKDGSTTVETMNMDDFSYTNTVNGPSKSYTFKNNIVKGKTKLDSSKDYKVTVTAVGDGDKIKSASAPAYMPTKTAATNFATKFDTSASGTCGDYSVTVTIGLDASGNNIYELDASVNKVVVLRESGTYTTKGVITKLDGQNVYAENTSITLKSKQTDASASILDGKTLSVAKGQKMAGGGFPPKTATTYDLTGKGLSLNGTSFDLAASVASFGPM
jgi:hypothetical protein